ncbi:hypothetical protein C8F04DRAFT_1185234 [Mycena alexandri]|uniref:Uncharacterized protein n=1 Tax=Mycena alexandri TaxID=1745969 RepID=A0AAD6SS64_9AGAR|nr:hypothetical protein C8F04DRAFT_1185234 [Mycena alexandri]
MLNRYRCLIEANGWSPISHPTSIPTQLGSQLHLKLDIELGPKLGSKSAGVKPPNGHHESSWSTILFAPSIKQKEKLGIHKGLQFMGDIFLQKDDEATAISLFTLALQGFTLMDVHRSRAECMIRLGDISEKNGDLFNALELWEMARPLFERSSQTKQIQALDERMSRVDEGVKEQYQKNLAHLVEWSVPAGKVDEEDEEDSEIELEWNEVEVEQVVV